MNIGAIDTKTINELKNLGYSQYEIDDAVRKYKESELQSGYDDIESSRYNDPRLTSRHSSFMTEQDDNLIKWQLELNDILERAEHILRGDIPKYVNGVLIWETNKESNNPLNERGIQEIMKILAMYINRNTILSDYDDKEINLKVFDFGRRINNFIFMMYDEIGMDTDEKRKSYDLIVGELIDMVHSAYKRALHGGERRSLREMIQVSQSHQSTGYSDSQMFGMQDQNRQVRGTLNPMRYIKGKYV